MDKATLLEKTRPRIEAVNVEGVGEVHFRTMSGTDRAVLMAKFGDMKDLPEGERVLAQAEALLALTLATSEGNSMFDNGDAPSLREMDYTVLDKLAGHSQRINRLGTDAEGERKKDGIETPNSGSGTS